MYVPINRTFQFNPTGPYGAYLPQFEYTATATYTPPEKSVKDRMTYYFLRALVVIQSALRLLKSSSPFFEEYSPLLKQLPNMYKMIKLIQDVNEESETTNKTDVNEETDVDLKRHKRSRVSTPTLFI